MTGLKVPTCLLKGKQKQYTNQACNEYDTRRNHSNIIQTKSGNFYTLKIRSSHHTFSYFHIVQNTQTTDTHELTENTENGQTVTNTHTMVNFNENTWFTYLSDIF